MYKTDTLAEGSFISRDYLAPKKTYYLFDGWYTQEKADFDQGNYANVGHYLNIIDDSYTITGFAVNQKSAYCNTYGQVFSGMELEGDCFSVDDYCGFFMLYYNAVYNPVVLG